MRAAPALLAVGLALAAVVLSACVPEPSAVPTGPESTATASPSPTATPSPTPTLIALPTDCRAVLGPEVLTQLDGVLLNDPGFGSDAGRQPDGSMHCIWGRAYTDTGRLWTAFSYLDRAPALDMLDELQKDEGFTCFTSDGGTRCEKTWADATSPVMDGRTLFWRDGVLIDTRYSIIAPTGYTSSLIAHLWP
ncbi:hypothetical protein ABCS02_10925 [Microbacterium sp. X-17]|uniref:hypothetical protein n=1 Tax=Microbacterium sp. X-17 TaxID=3144404 RepID=UPI0031F49849